MRECYTVRVTTLITIKRVETQQNGTRRQTLNQTHDIINLSDQSCIHVRPVSLSLSPSHWAPRALPPLHAALLVPLSWWRSLRATKTVNHSVTLALMNAHASLTEHKWDKSDNYTCTITRTIAYTWHTHIYTYSYIYSNTKRHENTHTHTLKPQPRTLHMVGSSTPILNNSSATFLSVIVATLSTTLWIKEED